MPLEAINCTNCGSSDLQEVKPSTYFCNHCDAVFKHTDPTRVTVQREFCECGGAVAYQCRLCRTGICHGHDVWRAAYPGAWKPQKAVSLEFIPTARRAYQRPDLPPGTGYCVYPVGAANPDALVDAVNGSFVGGEVHLCSSCVWSLLTDPAKPAGALVDQLAEAKIANRICADPQCAVTATCACDCCRLAWCSQHVSTTRTFPWKVGDEVRPLWTPTGTVCDCCNGHWWETFRVLCRSENIVLPSQGAWSYGTKARAATGRLQRRVNAELPATLVGPCPNLTDDGVELPHYNNGYGASAGARTGGVIAGWGRAP